MKIITWKSIVEEKIQSESKEVDYYQGLIEEYKNMDEHPDPRVKMSVLRKEWTDHILRSEDKIASLEETLLEGPLTEETMVMIVGTSSLLQCGECKVSSEILIEIGEEPYCESRTAYVCPKCMKKGMDMLYDACIDEALEEEGGR